MPTREDLVESWWSYVRLAAGSREQRKALEEGLPEDAVAAWTLVEDLVDAGGPDALALMSDLIDARPDEVAAAVGPLEDLIHEHGDQLMEALDERARRSPAFARALSHVWIEPSSLRPETVERLRRWT